MTNCETFCDADPECGNMFPPRRGAGDICGKPRLSSLSWQQLESWRRWSKLVELNRAKTDRTRNASWFFGLRQSNHGRAPPWPHPECRPCPTDITRDCLVRKGQDRP